MSRNAKAPFYLILLLVLCMLPAFAAQETKEAAPAEALKTRVALYYGSLQKGDYTTALNLVAPESKNDFARMNYDGLQEFRILDTHLSDAGDTAAVRLLRTDNFPGFPQLLDHQTVDTWKQIGGQWYVLLPVPKENEALDTPFGKITFARRGNNDQPVSPPPLFQKQVSPEEAKQALLRAMLEANKKKMGDQEEKPQVEKSADKAVPKQASPEKAKKAQKAKLEAKKQKSSDRDKKPEDKKSEDPAAPKPNPPN
jgi:hypothetical protein